MICNYCKGLGIVPIDHGHGAATCEVCNGTGNVDSDAKTCACDCCHDNEEHDDIKFVIETLDDTIAYMKSGDYKKRFVAEYYQTLIRYEKLRKMLIDLDSGHLSFQPDSPRYVLKEQIETMSKYLYCLEVRAEAEHIDLESFAP